MIPNRIDTRVKKIYNAAKVQKMNREENLFLAKKLFSELVYHSAYVEGCNVTFPQTQTILDGGIAGDVSVGDIQTVLNLRDGWRFVLANIDTPLSVDFLCKINEHVSRNESLQWGVLRSGEVGISGTAYRPEIPVSARVEVRLREINAISDPIERGTELFCYAVHSQLFWDGNKRTATMAATKILIEGCAGVLTIDEKNALEFNKSLLHYYNTADKTPLKAILKKCIKTK